jgi:hypothetical protein
MAAPHQAIARAIDVYVFIARTSEGGMFRSLERVGGWLDGRYELHPLT